jgi:hypothetical protein
MNRLLKGSLTVLLLCGMAAPAFAGAVYVPIADTERDGVTYETRISVSNQSDTPRRFTAYFIPAVTDGTVRPPDGGGTDYTVAPFSTMILDPPSQVGMIEISGAPQLVVQANLVSIIDGVPQTTASVPVVSSENLWGAGETANVQSWQRSQRAATDYVLINLAHEANQCEIDVFRANGTQIGTTAVLTLPALSVAYFDNVLALLGQNLVADVRSTTSCTMPFYVYSNLLDDTTGEATLLAPSQQLNSALLPPGEDPSPGPGASCTPGVVCFEQSGVFHIPSANNPVHREVMTPPTGTYAVLRARLQVQLGNWFPGNPSGTHNIFWLVRDRNRDMFGYVNLQGPPRNQIFIRHGFNQSQGQKARITAGFAFQEGAIYNFDYIYDTAARLVELVVTDFAGTEVLRMQGAPNINGINFSSGQQILMDFGFPEGVNPNEPPTYGWVYSNLVVELF